MNTALDFWVPLFVPGDRPERFNRAASSDCDAVIVDLEDAISSDRKAAARAALQVGFTDKPILVRVNGIGTPWHDADMHALAQKRVAAVILPKAECTVPLRGRPS